MKSAKESISKPVTENESIFRDVAEIFFDCPQDAISGILADRLKCPVHDSRYRFWYNEMHNIPDEEGIQSARYEYLGDDGVVLFLLFLAEYEENP